MIDVRLSFEQFTLVFMCNALPIYSPSIITMQVLDFTLNLANCLNNSFVNIAMSIRIHMCIHLRLHSKICMRAVDVQRRKVTRHAYTFVRSCLLKTRKSLDWLNCFASTTWQNWIAHFDTLQYMSRHRMTQTDS